MRLDRDSLIYRLYATKEKAPALQIGTITVVEPHYLLWNGQTQFDIHRDELGDWVQALQALQLSHVLDAPSRPKEALSDNERQELHKLRQFVADVTLVDEDTHRYGCGCITDNAIPWYGKHADLIRKNRK